jgi:nucleolar complex protein 2
MAHKQSKATKKFEKKKLKPTLEKRKEFAKVKQRHQVKAKKKARTEKRFEKENVQDESETGSNLRDGSSDNLDDDKYFRHGIPIPEATTLTKQGTSSLKQHTGKRKRSVKHDDSEESASQSGAEGSEDTGLFESEGEDELEDHKGQLDALAQKDPEFYKYLKENDAELLDFDEDDDLVDVDALSEGDEDGYYHKKQKKDARGSNNDKKLDNSTITAIMVKTWRESMAEKHSVRALRQVVLAFRAAAHLNDEDDKEFKFSIPNADIYHEVLTVALKGVPPVLNHHLPVKQSAGGKIRIPTHTPKFKTLSPLIKTHASSLHYLMSHLSDAATLKLALQSFEPLMPYLLQFRKFLKLIIKSVVSIWSDNSSAEATRITAFLILRRLIVIGDPGIREAVLRSTYEGIIKGSRNTTIHTLAGVNLMKNSAAELWGIDQTVGYTTGFTFIRQLAIHLRGNITKPTKDSYKTIYNWQFVHSLDFWSRVLSTHCNSLVEAKAGNESHLRPLIYPVVQITLGVMRLIPTSTYFPIRFQLMRGLLRISQASGTYIPLASALLEVLNSAEMKKPPRPATLRPLDFSSIIRAPISYLKTRVYQDGVGEQVVELFSEFFVLWTKSVAFPELQLPVSVMLKRWLRTSSSKTTGNKNAKVNQGLLLLVQKIEANARWIEERRNKVTFAPKDRAEIEAFLRDTAWEDTPFGAFVVSQRKMREERKKIVDQGRLDEERRRRTNDSGPTDLEEDEDD